MHGVGVVEKRTALAAHAVTIKVWDTLFQVAT
jgi:hypothetical protein